MFTSVCLYDCMCVHCSGGTQVTSSFTFVHREERKTSGQWKLVPSNGNAKPVYVQRQSDTSGDEDKKK